MPRIRGRKADTTGTAGTGQRANSIGLPARDLDQYLDRLDERGDAKDSAIKRTFARWPFRQASLRLILEHPGGSRSMVQVACRNLSRGGTALLHNAYVHANTPCVLELPRLDGQMQAIRSMIVRCNHTQGTVHELGVKFTEPVLIEDFVQLNPLMGWNSFEKVDPEKLVGSLLVVTDSELDAKVIKHFLGDSQLKIRLLQTSAEAALLERDAGDIAIIDLGVEGAAELFESMRAIGVVHSLVAMGPDATAETRMTIQDVHPDGFVFKPLSSERLLAVIAECLIGGDAIQVDPTIAGEAGGALAANCIEQLRGFAVQIREALAEDDAMRCYAICQQVKAASIAIRLHQIVGLADQAATSLAQSMSCSESNARLQELARACERIRLSRAAS